MRYSVQRPGYAAAPFPAAFSSPRPRFPSHNACMSACFEAQCCLYVHFIKSRQVMGIARRALLKFDREEVSQYAKFCVSSRPGRLTIPVSGSKACTLDFYVRNKDCKLYRKLFRVSLQASLDKLQDNHFLPQFQLHPLAVGRDTNKCHFQATLALQMCISIGSALGLSCTKDRAKRILLSSAGLISDAYDLFVIDLVKLMLAELYPMSVTASAAVSLAALVGALIGQIFWGIAGDTIGRARSFVITAAFVAVGSIGSASAVSSPHALNIFTQLAIWRSAVGFGIGGDYPLSASLTAGGERPEIKSVALVFASQGVGRLLACFVNWAVLATGLQLDVCWRISLALGALPTIVTFYWRWKVSRLCRDSFLRCLCRCRCPYPYCRCCRSLIHKLQAVRHCVCLPAAYGRGAKCGRES